MTGLTDLKKLRHLQFPSSDWELEFLKFDASMNLESICILGVPAVSSFNELTNLPQLKKLVIVDSDSEFENPVKANVQLLRKLRALLPKVTVSIETTSEHRLDIPREFLEYKNKLMKENIKK